MLKNARGKSIDQPVTRNRWKKGEEGAVNKIYRHAAIPVYRKQIPQEYFLGCRIGDCVTWIIKVGSTRTPVEKNEEREKEKSCILSSIEDARTIEERFRDPSVFSPWPQIPLYVFSNHWRSSLPLSFPWFLAAHRAFKQSLKINYPDSFCNWYARYLLDKRWWKDVAKDTNLSVRAKIFISL